MTAQKKTHNPLANLQSALDALQARVQHFAWLGASQRDAAHNLIARSKSLLDPEPALELAQAMNEISDVLDGVVAGQRQRIVDTDAERQAQLDAVQAIKADHERRREENRQRRIALGATPIT